MSRLPLLVLAVAALAAALVLFLHSGDESEGGTASVAGPSALGPGGAESAPPADLQAAGGAGEDGARKDVLAETEADAATDPDAEQSFDLAGARWIDVEVRAPMDAPPEPDLHVVAWTEHEDRAGADGSTQGPGGRRSRLRRNGSGADARATFDDEPEGSRLAWSVRPVEGGRARVPVPADATGASLQLDARYLALPEPHDVTLEDHEAADARAVLEPELGAWIVGSIALPPGAADRGVVPGEVAGSVRLEGGSMTGGRRRGGMRFVSRSVELDGGVEFEFGGVLPGVILAPAAWIDGLADARGEVFETEPGRRYDLVLAPTLGAVVTGTVRDEGGDALGGADVSVERVGRDGMFGVRQRDLEATSGEDGTFRVAGVPPGEIRVEADMDGRRGARVEDLEVVDGETLGDVELVLELGGVIAGVVRWPDGSPAAGARIGLAASGDDEDRRSARPFGDGVARGGGAADSTADDEGRFRVSGLPESPHLVAATCTPEDGGPVWAARAPGVPAGTRDLELVLEESTTVEGLVVDRSGAPVTAFFATARRVTRNERGVPGNRTREEFEDEEGRFELAGLFEGTWRVGVDAEGYHAADDGARTIEVPYEGPPLRFELVRDAAIAGLVLDPGGVPVEGATVRLDDGEGGGGPFAGMAFAGNGDETGVTGPDGRFRIEGLEPGVFRVVAMSEDWAASEPVPVEVAAGGESTDVVLTLRVGGRITGHVHDETGAPWAGRSVGYGAGAMLGAFGNIESTTTDAGGAFAFEHVTPGEWSVTASPPQRELVETMRSAAESENPGEAFMDLMSRNLTESVVVADGEEVYVSLGAEPRDPVRLVGRVDEGDEPVAGAQLFAVAEGGALLTGLKSTRTDATGAFSIELDRPGAYVLSVQRGARRNQFPLDVPDVEEHVIELSLPTGGIAGVVYGTDGDPAGGVRVTVEREGGFAFSRFDPRGETTGDDGSYSFEGLDAGTYAVRVGNRGFGRGADEGYGAQIVGGVVVEPDERTVGVDVHLTGAGRVTGRVRDVDGDPVAGADVFVRDAAGRPLSSVSAVRTDASGRFVRAAVAPGTYTVSVRTKEGAAPDAHGVTVREDDDVELSFTVEPATTLLIRAIGEDDEPVRATVSVRDEDGREMSGLVGMDAMQETMTRGVSTSEQRVGPLPPGRYTVTATATDGRSRTKRVTVRNRPESTVLLRLRD